MTPDSDLVRAANMVFVTFNYRLGALGFLALNVKDPETSRPIRGNFGLMDQHAAMQWVHDNIHQFGGNPNKVSDQLFAIVHMYFRLCLFSSTTYLTVPVK